MTTAPDQKIPADEVVRNLLLLCGITVPIEIVAAQTSGDRHRAAKWAAAEHLHASDNFDVERRPKPDWLTAFELLSSGETARQTALERWAWHLAQVEGAEHLPCANQTVTLSLAEAAIMAQQIVVHQYRERAAAALAAAAVYGAPQGEGPAENALDQMTRALLGTDEAYAEFAARFIAPPADPDGEPEP
jgi:hypothetical protein